MLLLPYTMPDDASGFQIISVVEDMNDYCKMHVNLADVMDEPESWGMYLADVARVIAHDHAEHFGTTEVDAFAAICSGFYQWVSEATWRRTC
jgi:hypothetical protein